MGSVLCVDVGSTFTKAVLVDPDDGAVLAGADHPTTADALTGLGAVRDAVCSRAGVGVADVADLRVCSSAGGGLRIAVVGYEQLVTARAGHRVALSAGGRVVHVHAGPLDVAGVGRLRASRPDLILLVGGTDGGNGEVLVHNATRLAGARVAVPVVLAGNADAAAAAAAVLRDRGRRVVVAANVLPRIGVLDPAGARAAIREVFLRHVIGGKGLSRGTAFARMVRGATPDVVLAGVEVLADGAGEHSIAGTGDVLVVDVGGATTDVYSVLTPRGQDGPPDRDVVATLWRARTVEGDLGMRSSAPGVVTAARQEGLLTQDEAGPLAEYAERVAAQPALLPADPADDLRLARLAVAVAVRRHGRPDSASGRPRPLAGVGLVVGSGGVLRHHGDALRAAVLAPLLVDHAGGWRVPEHAALMVDSRYLLFAAGLLAPDLPRTAAALLVGGLTPLLPGRVNG